MTTTALDRELLVPIPDDGHLWIFGADRDLTPQESGHLLAEVDAFLSGWRAHGHPLAARHEWVDPRFLLVGADPRVTVPSGCSIDALVRTLKGVEEALGVGLVGKGLVWYRDSAGALRSVTRAEFRAAAASGAVTPETPVFDLSLSRVEEVRKGWEAPARERWHSTFFR